MDQLLKLKTKRTTAELTKILLQLSKYVDPFLDALVKLSQLCDSLLTKQK